MTTKKKSPKPVEAQAAEDVVKASKKTAKKLQDIEKKEMEAAVKSRAINVVTVKIGLNYKAEYANKMFSMLKRHLAIPFNFYCITDCASNLNPEINVITPPEVLQGWWNKLYVFSDLMPDGSMLYLDLDQVILDDITEIVETCQQYPFACYADHIEWQGVKLGTAWMQFRAKSMTDIFEYFWQNRRQVMYEFQSGGDQIFLGKHLKDVFYWNEHFPDAVVSYKFDLKKGNPKIGNKLVNFHGRPKPSQVTDDWVKEHWQ